MVSRRCFCWAKQLEIRIFVAIILSHMCVSSYSFQAVNKLHFCAPRYTRPKNFCKEKDFPLNNLDKRICFALHLGEEDQEAFISDHTRREFFAFGPALGMALSLKPFDANAVEVISRNAGTGTDVSNIIPFSSVRKSKTITLSNGLRVLLVNDKRASQSTAALIVDSVGQFSDFAELPGLAHLMEHMILSCSSVSKFGKGDLEDWLATNEGASNAFTAYQQVKSCIFTFLPGKVEPNASHIVHTKYFRPLSLILILAVLYISTDVFSYKLST